MQAADDHARRQRGRRLDDQVVAAPDVERRLLEQEREADREQHLAQRVEAERPQKDPLYQYTEDAIARAATGSASSQEPVDFITVSAT